MNKLVLVAVLASTIIADDTFKPRTYFNRTYDPKEEDENRIPYILWEHKNGSIYLEDLTRNPNLNRNSAISISDITLYLYTINNKLEGNVIKPEDFSTLLNSTYFDETKEVVFIIHGWTNNYKSPVNTDLTSALLASYDLNVFVVDWSEPASKFYTTAKSAVPSIGLYLGNFVNKMMDVLKISSKSISFMGHSLGAHVAGCAGAVVNPKINYIIGLDPALPLYTLGNIDNRLDPSDADFVQIIHTNGGLLGFHSAIGHSDYYPNGGYIQPGCGLDLTGSCSHARSYLYLAESIYHSRFSARLCDSLKNYHEGHCSKNQESFLGEYYIDKIADGDFYLLTNSHAPFAKEE